MIRLSFNRWGFRSRKLWPVLRVGNWLLAVHPAWLWSFDRYERDPFSEETRSGWSALLGCIEISHVKDPS